MFRKPYLYRIFFIIPFLFVLSCVSKPGISDGGKAGNDEEISVSGGENQNPSDEENGTGNETGNENGNEIGNGTETQTVSSSENGSLLNEDDFYVIERLENPIISETPVKYKKTVSGYQKESKNRAINQKELSEDLDMFSYLVETCYAGYEKACENGLELKKITKSVRKKFLGKTAVTSDEFVEALARESWSYINDMHFQLFTNDRHFWYCPHQDLYFSNTYVIQEGDEYRIFLTDSAEVKIGEKYTGSEENLFYYPSRGLNVFRIGLLSNLKTDYVSVHFENGIFNLPVKNYSSPVTYSDYVYEEREEKDYAYIKISSFNMPSENSDERENAEEIFKKYSESAIKFRGKKNIVLDLRGNSGGNMNVSLVFPINLYSGLTEAFFDGKNYTRDEITELYMSLIYKDCIMLDSPGTVQNALEYVEKYFPENKTDLEFLRERNRKQIAHPVKAFFPITEYARSEKQIDYRIPKKSAFTGRIFFLIDRNSASASEDIISFTKKLFESQAEVFTVGENSSGCIDFGGVLLYQLPNSKINLLLPQSAFYLFENTVDTWKGEGTGHVPDFWCTDDDLEETLKRLL